MAAIEASWDEAAFAPEAIRRAVGGLIELAEATWHGTPRAPADRSDAQLIEEWVRSRGISSAFGIRQPPTVDVLRVVNRPGETEDRASVRVRLTLEPDGRPARLSPRALRIDERWTLGRHGTVWHLLETHGDPFSATALSGRMIPGAWADEGRLRERSLSELADADTVNGNPAASDLGRIDDPAETQLADLSVVDGRFLPDLLEASLQHILEAWEEATTGPDQPLRELTTPQARRQLLTVESNGDEGRLVMRDATLTRWWPVNIEPDPPAMEIALLVEAVRYITATASLQHLAGSQNARRTITLTWKLEPTDSTEAPWRLVQSSNPAAEIAGFTASDAP